MRVLFATAELAQVASVGGLGEAAGGLVGALRRQGLDVDVVLPDYSDTALMDEQRFSVDVPGWAGPATGRRGRVAGIGELVLVEVPGIRRTHPYVDEHGSGWPDNSDRFFAFSAAVASIAGRGYDVLHCNDWHTSAAIGMVDPGLATVLTIHTLGHQGWTSGGWLDRIPRRPDLFEAYGGTNPLAGGIQLADRVIAVSEHYAEEILTEEGGSGLHMQLRGLGDRLVGIRNGIDVGVWNPESDTSVACRYSADDPEGKTRCRTALIDRTRFRDDGVALVGVVSRLVDQKGIDFVLEAVRFAEGIPFRLAILGSGERWIADWARWAAADSPDRVWFFDGFDARLAHEVFAGADLLLMPSRFEPCGLAQMQAMAYGTIPIVTPVGGLVDTVVDADRHPRRGSGFVTSSVDAAGVVDATHRAVRALRNGRRTKAIRRRGMKADWSWTDPASRHVDLYEDLIRSRS